MSDNTDHYTKTTVEATKEALVVTPTATASPDIEAMQVSDTTTADSEVRVPLTRIQFTLVYVGLLLAIFLASLDQTIVSTALKSIIEDLGSQDKVAWLGSSYLMTAAPLGPLYGKFADIFGRKWVFVFAILVFEIGSLMCGIATSMNFLIAGRAISGIGGGGIFSLVLIIISDIVSLRDRGKYQGLIGAVFGLSSVIGPVVGGSFSDHVSWRWCFFINLPLGAITLATVITFLNFPPLEGTMSEKLKRIDGIGAVVLFGAIICLITPLQLGGTTWEWNSPQVIAMFVISVVMFAAFAYVEVKIAKEPIVPASIFVNRSVPALLGVSLMLGAGFMSGIYYVSLFFQVVFGYSATQAGLSTIPMVFGLVLMSITCGLLISKTGTYRHFLFIGPVIMAVGIVLMSFLNGQSSLVQQIFYLGIFGFGVGTMIQTRILGIQAAVPVEMIAVATAVAQTGNTLGGAVGVAITGTIFNNVIVSATEGKTELLAVVAQLKPFGADVRDVLPLLGLISRTAATRVPADPIAAKVFNETMAAASSQLIAGFNQSFKTAYLCLLPYPVLIIVFACFVQQFQMRGKDKAVVAE
ncbi:hypothetical protein CcCBS67573_g05395 [Chytriomyces confervae]|uniref:Major facilitator superfamily (MFS) profile domain-containing protein n=1 Tax=Chytriomyces confervae TaxID=246404 RepID=A0A507FB15_9FUNG|nr:hypothetical protein CcCBS67573_g05395 [Chytriomyces confervae]